MIAICILLLQCIAGASTQGSIVLWQCDYFPEDPGPFDGCEWERTHFHHGEANIASTPNPEGGSSDVVRLFYPEDSFTGLEGDMKGGTNFYAQPFGSDRHITLEYQVYFSENFDFVKGGKLPGLYGGQQDGANSCSGGGSDQHCFSTRFHWRTDGQMEIYAYIPVEEEDWFCDEPDVICNFEFGHSFGRGAFSVELATWQSIAMDIQLNDPGEANGVFKMFYNAEEVYSFSGLTIRRDDSMVIDKIFFSTFFGGGDESYASTDDVYIYFRDFKVLAY